MPSPLLAQSQSASFGGESAVQQQPCCAQGVKVYLSSQCASGDLQPELYRAGSAALGMGVEGGPQMTPEVLLLA